MFKCFFEAKHFSYVILDITLSKIALFIIEDKMSVNMFIYTILICDCAQIEAKKGNRILK